MSLTGINFSQSRYIMQDIFGFRDSHPPDTHHIMLNKNKSII